MRGRRPERILVLSYESRKYQSTGFCVGSENNLAPHRLPPRSIFLATDPLRAPPVYSTSSLSLSLPPPPRSLIGPHNLMAPHLRLHPSSLMCSGALGSILCTRQSILILRGALIFSGPSLRTNSRKPCCQITWTWSTALVRGKLSEVVSGMFNCPVHCGGWISVQACICRSAGHLSVKKCSQWSGNDCKCRGNRPFREPGYS